jgi:hypothetical protein
VFDEAGSAGGVVVPTMNGTTPPVRGPSAANTRIHSLTMHAFVWDGRLAALQRAHAS